MTARAVFPGALSTPVAAIRTHSTQKRSPPVSCSTGTAATAAQQAPSETTLTGLAPARSTNGPLTSELTVAGSIVHTATIPAFPALPVVKSTSHGTPTSVMPSPATDSSAAPRRTASGRGGCCFKASACTRRQPASRQDDTTDSPRALGYPPGPVVAQASRRRWYRPGG